MILVSLGGTALAFSMLAVTDTLTEIYLARVLGGFFAASIGTAQAIVTDVTSPSERARGMGLIGAAFGLGFVIGPFVGGELASVDERLPFLAVTLLATLNLGVAALRLPESHPPARTPPDWRALGRSLVPAPARLLAAVHGRRIALYLSLFFVMFAAFSALESMFTLYLYEKLGMTERDAGRIFAWDRRSGSRSPRAC